MTDTIRALPTTYEGITFRSRLEARWAVAFDEEGLRWEYEPQGYELPSGRWYLPDFLLTRNGVTGLVEIKPQFMIDEQIKGWGKIEPLPIVEACQSLHRPGTIFGGMERGDQFVDYECFSNISGGGRWRTHGVRDGSFYDKSLDYARSYRFGSTTPAPSPVQRITQPAPTYQYHPPETRACGGGCGWDIPWNGSYMCPDCSAKRLLLDDLDALVKAFGKAMVRKNGAVQWNRLNARVNDELGVGRGDRMTASDDRIIEVSAEMRRLLVDEGVDPATVLEPW